MTVKLRLFTPEDCAILEANPRTPENNRFSFFGFEDPDKLRRRLEAGELHPKWGAHNGQLAIEAHGEFVGEVSWHPEQWGPPPSVSLNFGIDLLPTARGKGYGTEAQRQLIAYLFMTTTVYRIEASTDVENIAEQRSLEKAGLLREGVIRGSHWREGRWNDMVSYGITRADFEEQTAAAAKGSVRTGFTA